MRKIAKFIRLFILGVVFSLILSGCNSMANQSNGTNSRTEEKIQIVATIAQIGEPMQIIGGDRVEVKSLMGPGVDPHLYKATQGDISTLQNADMCFYSGLHLEGNMGEIFSKLSESKATFTLGESIDESLLLKSDEGVRLILIFGSILTYGKRH